MGRKKRSADMINDPEALWRIADINNFVQAHASDYLTAYDALYEYMKNLEERPCFAKNIHIEFLPLSKIILIYGDGNGMNATQLDEIKNGIGRSQKDVAHHGLGILAFMKFASKMTVFSRKESKIYILSCMGHNSDIVSDSGKARVLIPEEDSKYERFYKKLYNNLEGTITILEGIGDQKTRFCKASADEVFDKNQPIQPIIGPAKPGRKKEHSFVKWAHSKLGWSLTNHQYSFKSNETAKLQHIKPKLGHGKLWEFTIPSKEYPIKTISKPDRILNRFELNGRSFEITSKFLINISPSNEGDIKISEDQQNALDIRDAVRSNKVSTDSVYKNQKYTKYLNGLIDFSIRPLDGGESINIYTGSRSSIIMEGPFGECLGNMLIYADINIIRPKVERVMTESSADKKDERRSQSLQNDLETLFRERSDIFESIIGTQSHGVVPATNYVGCFKCKLSAIPKRGEKLADILRLSKQEKHDNIYAPEDDPSYYCGNCGYKWARKIYKVTGPAVISTAKPIYEQPGPDTEAKQRKKLRGFGFTVSVCPLQSGDTRRFTIYDDKIKINGAHPDYKEIEKNKPSALSLYERDIAVKAIVNYELKKRNAHHDEYEKKINDTIAALHVFQAKKKQGGAEQETKLLEFPEKPTLAPAHTVDDLKNKFNAK